MPSRQEKKWELYFRERFLNKVKKKIAHSPKGERVRRRDWLTDNPDDAEFAHPTEPIMPRGERSRRQAALDQAIAATNNQPEMESGIDNEPVGVVVEVGAGVARVELAGEVLLCSLGRALRARDSGSTPIAVGDLVLLRDGVVETVQPRGRVLARPDTHNPRFEQVVVANVDQILIVASWNHPPMWPELIDRYLITAERNGLAPILCVSKLDLAEGEDVVEARLKAYRQISIATLCTSTVTGAGLEDLRQALRGRITVLAGLSGAGKSSLINALQPGLDVRTQEVGASGDGRHTTTQSRLWHLEIGGAIIDTPGIREWGLAGLMRSDLAGFYPELQALRARCRFRDCLHVAERDCAVIRAVEEGGIRRERYHSYVRILQSLKE